MARRLLRASGKQRHLASVAARAFGGGLRYWRCGENHPALGSEVTYVDTEVGTNRRMLGDSFGLRAICSSCCCRRHLLPQHSEAIHKGARLRLHALQQRRQARIRASTSPRRHIQQDIRILHGRNENLNSVCVLPAKKLKYPSSWRICPPLAAFTANPPGYLAECPAARARSVARPGRLGGSGRRAP
jgi:hypothetical protein